MPSLPKITAPALVLAFAVGLAIWAYPEGGAPARQAGIVAGWLGCGMLLGSLFLVLREPRLAATLGGLENMYWWHHRFGVAAYVVLLVHPVLLAAASLPGKPREGWQLLSPISESWPVWVGWLGLLLLMAGLAATFITRLPYGIKRPVHAALGAAVLVGLIHLLLLGIDEPVPPFLLAAGTLLAWRWVREDWGMGARPYVVHSAARLSTNAVEVTLAPLGEPISVQPGQFALFAFRAGRRFRGCGEFHPFTVSSTEGTSRLRIAVKALGDCTREMQFIESGVMARVQGAFGDFLQSQKAAPQYWIAGGIGVTPFLALLREGRVDRPTTLIYIYHSDSDGLFVDELQAIAATLPQLTLQLQISGGRHVTPENVLPASQDLGAAEFWLCGPPAMATAFSRYLRGRGIAARLVHYENFGSL